MKNIESVRVHFDYFSNLKNEILTFIPETKEDKDFGEHWIDRVICLEQPEKKFNVPPFITKDILPGLLQMQFPSARIEIIYSSCEMN